MKKILTTLIFVLITVGMMAINIHHIPSISIKSGDVITMELEVRTGFNEIQKIEIYYREMSIEDYQLLEMEKGSSSNPVFSIKVEDILNYKSTFEYYFLITEIDGNTSTMPAIQPQVNPYIVQIEDVENLKEGFVLLSPDSKYSDIGKNFVVAISTFAFDNEIKKIEFFFDGKNVTKNTKIYTNTLIYKAENVSHGFHTYFAKAYLKNGSTIESRKWSTKVTKKIVELPFNLTGRGVLKSYFMEKSNDTNTSQDNKRTSLLFTINGRKKWFNFNSKIYLSSLESDSTQMVNRYFLNVHIPHFDINVGDYSPNYGSFIMFGKNVRGLHSKLDFKYLRLLFSAGKTKKSLDGSDSTFVGTFERNALSARMEIGSRRGFSLGVSFSKTRDDKNSLRKEFYIDESDSSYVVTPKDNLIVGTDLSLALFKQRLKLGAEVAMSYYNSNIMDGAMNLDSINAEFETDIELPFDPIDYENIFIINRYIEPFMPGLPNLAYKTYLRAFFLNNLINISYSTVGANFNSLSTSYQQKDMRIVSFSDNLRLLNNKISLNLSANFSSDNVYRTKEVTSKMMNFQTQILFIPNETMNYQIAYYSNNTADDIKTSKYQTNNIIFGSSYKVETIPLTPTMFSINLTNSSNELVTKDSIDGPWNNISNYISNNISISANSTFDNLPFKTRITYALSLNNDDISSEKTMYNSFYLKGIFEFLDSKLKPYIDFRFTSYDGDYNKNSKMFNLGSIYKFTSQTYFSTNVGLLSYIDNADPSQDYNQFNFNLTISQKF